MSDVTDFFATIGMTGIDTPVLACRSCGSVVAFDYWRDHVDFHARIAELEQANASA